MKFGVDCLFEEGERVNSVLSEVIQHHFVLIGMCLVLLQLHPGHGHLDVLHVIDEYGKPDIVDQEEIPPLLFYFFCQSFESFKKHTSHSKLVDKKVKSFSSQCLGERKTRKGQNRIKTGQKQEAWRSPEKSKPITVKKERKYKSKGLFCQKSVGLPKFKYNKEHLCPSCEQGKRRRASHPLKPLLNSRQRLHLLHMDLCGPMRIASINGKRYVLVIVDDYSRYTWVDFLRSKDKALEVIKTFLKRITVLLQIFNRRTKKIMKTMNVLFNELFAMAFEQRSSKPRLQRMTSGQISSGLDLTYAPSTITTQQPSEDTAPTPTNSSSHATNMPITSQDVDELNLNPMVDGNTFVNPFVVPSTSDAESSSSYNVDPSNMHTFYQPYPHEFQ
uniref:Gag-Pol polyprotein n=1 Tax=Tanacetum cinerariifolium TaxID=118510 RepID=A0A699GN88_TANCI|nr:Gag-Pol polyprotein [Tanacetum cinerariifolium]